MKYANVTGLDLAFYRESWVYHTQHDTYARMGNGSMQHEGDNVLAYARYVLTHDVLAQSDLPRVNGVYFEVVGRWFVAYAQRTATLLNLAVVGVALLVAFSAPPRLRFSCTYRILSCSLSLSRTRALVSRSVCFFS